MRLRFQRPDGSIFEVPAPFPIGGQGWMLLPPEPDDMPVLLFPKADREETYQVTLAAWDMVCGACLRLWHKREEAWHKQEEANAKAVADVVGELKRLTSERDSWRLRAERAEQIVKAARGQPE
jgi:hypothetical protein